MSETERQLFESPAELVAIARAAHVARDRDLERAAKRELLNQFGITIKFPRPHAGRRHAEPVAQ